MGKENIAAAMDDEEGIGTGNDARIALLNQIADQNDDLQADDLENINDDGTTEAFTVQHADGKEDQLSDDTVSDPQTKEEIARLAAESGDDVPAAPEKFKIKVNGRELELTHDELIERAQKVEAADLYLKEAAELRNRQLKQQLPIQDVAPNTVDDDLAIVRAIQMGTEEEAVAALQTLRQSQQGGLSKDDISRTIDERLTFNEAINKFRTDYADIANDPYLNKLALDADAQLLAHGDKRPYWERYNEIGGNLRGWAKTMAKNFAPPVPPATQVVDKVARKAAAPSTPKVQSQKTVSSIEEEPEETTSSVIAGIAKQRGGPQWMQGRTH